MLGQIYQASAVLANPKFLNYPDEVLYKHNNIAEVEIQIQGEEREGVLNKILLKTWQDAVNQYVKNGWKLETDSTTKYNKYTLIFDDFSVILFKKPPIWRWLSARSKKQIKLIMKNDVVVPHLLN